MSKPIAIAAAIACAVFAASASAAHPYAIASAGLTRWDGKGTDAACDSSSCDRLVDAARLVLGIETSPGLAAELTFWDFGTFTAQSGGVRAKAEATAVGLGAAVWADMPPRWTGTARFGLASVDAKASNNVGFAADQSSIQLYAGLALGYQLMPRLWADAAWDLSQVRVDDAGIKDTVHALTLGLRLKF